MKQDGLTLFILHTITLLAIVLFHPIDKLVQLINTTVAISCSASKVDSSSGAAKLYPSPALVLSNIEQFSEIPAKHNNQFTSERLNHVFRYLPCLIATEQLTCLHINFCGTIREPS